MNKKNIKHYLIPGALGLVLVTQVQPAYAQESQGGGTEEKEVVVSESYEKETKTEKETYSVTEIEVEDKTQTKETEDKETKENINSEDYSVTSAEEAKSEKEVPYSIAEIEEVETEKGTVIPQGVDNSQLEKEQNNYSVTEIEEVKNGQKSKDSFNYKPSCEVNNDESIKSAEIFNGKYLDDSFRYKHEYEDENHNKNFQDHAIVVENDGTYKFKKGKELTQEEIDQEFEEYKKNASSFAKIQEWIPKLKEMNLLDLDDNEKSQFYKAELSDGKTIYSADGFIAYTNKYGRLHVHDLSNDKVYILSSPGTYKPDEIEKIPGYSTENIYGSLSEDIKNYLDDITNDRYKPLNPSDKENKETINSSGAYVKAIKDEDGNIVSYEFYKGGKLVEENKNKNLKKIKDVMKDAPSALMNEFGIDHYDEILDRAYMAALVNTYIKEHPEEFDGMSEEEHKDIIDYVYRFGLNFKSDESKISKSEDNGYVDVSPLGYATQNKDGSYKYRYRVSFNSITSNDRYSSTHLDIYAPTMAKNIKFFLTGVQDYKVNDDGTYSYEYRKLDKNIELGVVNTEDEEKKHLFEEEKERTISQKVSDWNNEEHKHKENTFSIPYFKDIGTRNELLNKVIQYGKHGSENKLDSGTTDKQKEYYKHYKIVNPQKGGPISFIVEFDIDENQVKKSPNIALGANIIGWINTDDPTAFYSSLYASNTDTTNEDPEDPDSNDEDKQVNEIIEKTLDELRNSNRHDTIFNSPELIKPGTFDINGFYGNAGGAPSEYTGDPHKIGLKVGKNSYGYGEYVEQWILKSNRYNIGNHIDINLRTFGASDFDIGVQIANGYGRYGDYRVNTRINEDEFIEKLMGLTDVKLVKSDNRISKDLESEIKEKNNNYRDVTKNFLVSDKNNNKQSVDMSVDNLKRIEFLSSNYGAPSTSEIGGSKVLDPNEPGNGAKDSLSSDSYFGSAGIGILMMSTSNINSPKGGVDVTPIGCAKQADGTWRYEYQISLRGVNSSDGSNIASDYNIVIPGFVKNVEFTLIGNNNGIGTQFANKFSDISDDLENYENVLDDEEKLVIEKIKKNLRDAGLPDELSNEQIEKIFNELQNYRIFNKNEKLSIHEWNPKIGRYISSKDELRAQRDKYLEFLNSIPSEIYEIIGAKEGKTGDKILEEKIKKVQDLYDDAIEDIDNQIKEKKKFLTEETKPSHIFTETPEDPDNFSKNIEELSKEFIISNFSYGDYEDIISAYEMYYESKKYRDLEELDKKYPEEIIENYKKDIDALNDKYREQIRTNYKNDLDSLNEKYPDETSEDYKKALIELDEKYMEKEIIEYRNGLKSLNEKYPDKTSEAYKKALKEFNNKHWDSRVKGYIRLLGDVNKKYPDETSEDYKEALRKLNELYIIYTVTAYKRDLKELNEKYPDKNSLEYRYAFKKLYNKGINGDYYYKKDLKELNKKYPSDFIISYQKDKDKINLDYINNLNKVKLSKYSWTGVSKMDEEYSMSDYKDVLGKPLNMITKLGYSAETPGIYGRVDLSKVDVYSFDSRGNDGVVGLRLTFDVDDAQVRKTPFVPVDVRNAWKRYKPTDDSEFNIATLDEYSKYLLNNNNMSNRVVNIQTGEEISQAEYKELSETDKKNYYLTNYYYVEHPEFITRDMFDIHGLHRESSVDVTSYTSRWQEIGEDVEPWGDSLRDASFDYIQAYKLYSNPYVTYHLGINEDYRDIAVVGPCAAQIRKIKENREISINKEWLNLGGISEIPDEISVVLSDGKNEKTVKLTKDNDFKFTISAESPLCSYTIKEIEVPGFEHKETNIKYRFVFRDSKTKEEKKTVYLNALNSEGKAETKEISIEELNKLISSGNYRIERPLNNDKIDKIGKDTIILEDGVIIVPHGIDVSTVMTVQLVNERTPEEPPEEPKNPPEEPETPPETPPEEPETPPETPPEEPEVPEEVEEEEVSEEDEVVEEIEKIQTPKETHGNPKTGVEGIGGMFALMASSLAGLFVTRKRKNK